MKPIRNAAIVLIAIATLLGLFAIDVRMGGGYFSVIFGVIIFIIIATILLRNKFR